MGKSITAVAHETSEYHIVAGVDRYTAPNLPYPVFANMADCDVPADVIIDFSRPDAVTADSKYAKAHNIPLMVATSGLKEPEIAILEELSKSIPVLRAANTSIGFNLILDLAKAAAQALSDTFDIEIYEFHHNQKVDAPSGGAYILADGINEVLDEKYDYVYDRHPLHEKRPKKEIGIHAIRGGTIVGEHTVLLAGQDERIEITHRSQSKDIFANGALAAAKFIYNKPAGLYGMKDVLFGNV
jgi:4-hydroxy-tetrahydrodipicolinate reductase